MLLEWHVEKEGVNLLSFLKERIQLDVSKKAIKRVVDQGGCKLNGKTERFSSVYLRRGDRVSLQNLFQTEEKPSIDILFENENFLILNKPKGLVSEEKKVRNFLQKEIILTHRLDKDTTGILVTAKNTEAKEMAEDAFRKREVEKKYLAIVDGQVHWNEKVSSGFLEKKKEYQGQSIWGSSERGFSAKTLFRCLRSNKEVSLIECQPVTGRTHQIRVHLKELGHPILGDHQYAKTFRSSFQPRRMPLHAAYIALPFEPFRLSAKVPKDMISALEQLGLPFHGISRR